MTQVEPYKVSICVPIYGVEKYIERCVRSLYEQTYKNIEYVFVNDCTPDKSMMILQEVQEDYPERKANSVIINHPKNRGLAAARNSAISNSQGKFIYWVDSDDYIECNTIELLVKEQQNNNADIVSANYYEDWGKNRNKKDMAYSTDDELWKNMILRRDTMISIWGRLVRKSLYTDNNIVAIEGCNMGEDFQVTPKLFFYAQKLALAYSYLYNYNRANETAYSFVFTEEKINQILCGLDSIKNFFADKNIKYQESLCIGEAKMLAMYTISCVRNNDSIYYQKLRNRMNSIDKSIVKQLSLSHKLVYRIRSYHFLKLLCNMGHMMKS